MNKFEYEGYLTEQKLVESLKNAGFDVKIQYKLPGHRYRYDAYFEHDGKKYFVEFHGHDHYMKADVQERDMYKSILAEENGGIYVEIPYFIQLTNTTWQYFFGFDIEVVSDYPHGFIDKKATLPGSFNVMGFLKFLKFFDDFASHEDKEYFDVAMNILVSLVEKSSEIPFHTMIGPRGISVSIDRFYGYLIAQFNDEDRPYVERDILTFDFMENLIDREIENAFIGYESNKKSLSMISDN